ncbi:MAG: imidazolonepropionase [Candidatus Eisenbacteria bacterium]|uniref:Imidazolonepropionase n=1 Tax=Eiseniibacteriota bacterium TaxID=2212470 RepID=A0A948W3S8_UNCEI|nr:imidazolonepropionase [Candidatus Eisenbacteria bacterium]MBU2691432.1 imidazolonepropionase [Candidatus Eisenbacteria bacterium]
MQDVDLLIRNAGQMAPLSDGEEGPLPGRRMDLWTLVKDGAIGVLKGRIVAVGETSDVLSRTRLQTGGVEVDASGCTVIPAFIDPHTHVLFAGSREWEFEERLRGRTYMEIAQAGGGIRSSVRMFRQTSDEEILRQSHRRIDRMIGLGTAVIEVKSGYALSVDQELRALRLIRKLAERVPVEIHATFMGAHEVPDEYRDRKSEYIDLVIHEMIPRVAEEGLAEFCDVFCEEGVFSVAESERILNAAARYGLRAKLHADELSPLGGAELAGKLRAVSADHLLHPSDNGLRAMKEGGVIPVLLPATSYSLHSKTYAPARRMIEMDLPVALATDCNPGSSMTESMPFVISLACLQMGLTPAEALSAATRNAAAALGIEKQAGSLAVGNKAHIQILDAPSYATLPYHIGVSHVRDLFIDGKGVFRDGQLISI